MANQYSAASAVALNPHDTKKALCQLYLNDGVPWREITRRTGLSSATISAIKKGEAKINAELAEALRKCEDTKLTLGIHGLLDHAFDPKQVAKMSSYQAVGSVGILIDKRELLAGRATSRLGYEAVPDQDLRRQIEDLERTIDVTPQPVGGGDRDK